MTRAINNKTQSPVSIAASIAPASIAVMRVCCMCRASDQRTFGKSIGSMRNSDT